MRNLEDFRKKMKHQKKQKDEGEKENLNDSHYKFDQPVKLIEAS